MAFEYDPGKSQKNRRKHGIDFDEAQKMWEGRVVEVPARDAGERRMMAIGMLEGKYWSAIITRRGTTVRLISVRRSRDEEKTIYEKKRNHR